MGEWLVHLLWEQENAGSSPVFPTITICEGNWEPTPLGMEKYLKRSMLVRAQSYRREAVRTDVGLGSVFIVL